MPYIAGDWNRHGMKVHTQVEGEEIVIGLDAEQKREF